jgi:hypothetical protein
MTAAVECTGTTVPRSMHRKPPASNTARRVTIASAIVS